MLRRSEYVSGFNSVSHGFCNCDPPQVLELQRQSRTTWRAGALRPPMVRIAIHAHTISLTRSYRSLSFEACGGATKREWVLIGLEWLGPSSGNESDGATYHPSSTHCFVNYLVIFHSRVSAGLEEVAIEEIYSPLDSACVLGISSPNT